MSGDLAKPAEIALEQLEQTSDPFDDALAHVVSEESRRAYRTAYIDFAGFLCRLTSQLAPKDPDELLQKVLPLLPKVSPAVITRYREDLRGRQLKPSTVNSRLAALSTLYTLLSLRGGIAINPARPELVGRLKTSRIATTHPLSREDASALLRGCASDHSVTGARDLALFSLIIYTGLRRTEAVSLDYDAVRLVGEVATFIVEGKGGKTRVIEVVPKVWQAIEAWCARGGFAEGPLFRPVHRGRGGAQKALQRRLGAGSVYAALKRRARSVGLSGPVHPHSLRHTHVTMALQAGETLPDVSEYVGHDDPKTTMRYYHPLDVVGRSPGRSIDLDW